MYNKYIKYKKKYLDLKKKIGGAEKQVDQEIQFDPNNAERQLKNFICKDNKKSPDFKDDITKSTTFFEKKLVELQQLLDENNIYYDNLGKTQKNFLEIEGEFKIANKELFKINNAWYNNY